MTKFEKATVPPEELRFTEQAIFEEWKTDRHGFRERFGKTEEEAIRSIHDYLEEMHARSEVFINDVYQVARRSEQANWVWLSVKRIDRAPVHDWRDLQEIKNQLIGPECEAVELFPAESRLCDTANSYHIWGSTDPTFRFPFGFNSPRLVFDDSIGKSINRKLK